MKTFKDILNEKDISEEDVKKKIKKIFPKNLKDIKFSTDIRDESKIFGIFIDYSVLPDQIKKLQSVAKVEYISVDPGNSDNLIIHAKYK